MNGWLQAITGAEFSQQNSHAGRHITSYRQLRVIKDFPRVPT